MEAIGFFGVLLLLGVALLRALLLPSQPPPPQIVYVQMEPVQPNGGLDFLSVLIFGALLAFVLLGAT